MPNVESFDCIQTRTFGPVYGSGGAPVAVIQPDGAQTAAALIDRFANEPVDSSRETHCSRRWVDPGTRGVRMLR
jgi:hypothetical protein